jgi:hypothetical protein
VTHRARISLRRSGNRAPATTSHANAETLATGSIGPSVGQINTSAVNSERAAIASPTEANDRDNNPR